MSGKPAVAVPHPADSGRGQYMTLWVAMTIATASAAILTRYCHIPATSIGFWRVIGAGVVLFPWWVVIALKIRPRPVVSYGAVLTGFFLGIHFATWAWALLKADVANAALFISLQPAVTPLIGGWLAGDRLNRWEYAGTGLACLGMFWILGGQIMFTPDQIPGSAMAFFSMLCCVVYFVLGRRYRSQEHVILFSVPVYLAAAATLTVGALLLDGGISGGVDRYSWAAIAGIILFPTVGGHTMAIYLLRHLKAHTIVLSIPVQFVLITLAGMVLFNQWPKNWFYPGAAVVVAGVVLAILTSGKRAPAAPPVEKKG